MTEDPRPVLSFRETSVRETLGRSAMREGESGEQTLGAKLESEPGWGLRKYEGGFFVKSAMKEGYDLARERQAQRLNGGNAGADAGLYAAASPFRLLLDASGSGGSPGQGRPGVPQLGRHIPRDGSLSGRGGGAAGDADREREEVNGFPMHSERRLYTADAAHIMPSSPHALHVGDSPERRKARARVRVKYERAQMRREGWNGEEGARVDV